MVEARLASMRRRKEGLLIRSLEQAEDTTDWIRSKISSNKEMKVKE